MRSVKLVVMSLVAVLAMSMAISASAFAGTLNPLFGEGTSETALTSPLGITAAAVTNQELVGATATIVCTSVGVESGAQLLTGGNNEETLKYTGCTVKGKTEAECHVSNDLGTVGTITTELLASKLAWKTKKAAEEEKQAETVTLFTPKTGTKFTSLEFNGSSCPFGTGGGHEVKGEVAVNNVAPATHKLTHELEAPKSKIEEYYLNEGGTATKHTVNVFKVTGIFETGATYVGKSSVTAGTEWSVIK
jgi:hypothetical protein